MLYLHLNQCSSAWGNRFLDIASVERYLEKLRTHNNFVSSLPRTITIKTRFPGTDDVKDIAYSMDIDYDYLLHKFILRLESFEAELGNRECGEYIIHETAEQRRNRATKNRNKGEYIDTLSKN